MATDGDARGGRGPCRKHYKYIEVIKYATGQLGEVRLMIKHLANCQPCRQDCENVKETARKITEAFAAIEKEKDS